MLQGAAGSGCGRCVRRGDVEEGEGLSDQNRHPALPKWGTNAPADVDAPRERLAGDCRTREQERADYLKWRAQFVEGPPHPTAASASSPERT